MAYSVTTATRKISRLLARIRAVQGGTSAGKTVPILLLLIARAQSDKSPTVTSVVSESLPHLKLGALRDFKLIMQSHGYWDENRWNATDYAYTFETGSVMEFFGVDNLGKVTGPRRDRLFVNEANHVALNVFDQLEVRTKEFVYLDWNPSEEFWFYTDVLGKRSDVEHLIVTYLDNEALDPRIRESIEQRKGNAAWWRVYGLGQLGTVEGRIYRDWNIINEVPHEAKLIRRGLDFGFTNDPTACDDIYGFNGGFIIDEAIHQLGMHNREIAEFLKLRDKCLTVADSSEPKSIAELRLYGLNVIGAQKGAGSIKRGIDFVQDQRISITKASVNAIREYRNYLWLTDPVTGKSTNDPRGGDDHHMDAIRYAFSTLIPTADDFRKRLPDPKRPRPYYGRNFQTT